MLNIDFGYKMDKNHISAGMFMLIVIFNSIVGSVAVFILQLMSVCSELFHSGGN